MEVLGHRYVPWLGPARTTTVPSVPFSRTRVQIRALFPVHARRVLARDHETRTVRCNLRDYVHDCCGTVPDPVLDPFRDSTDPDLVHDRVPWALGGTHATGGVSGRCGAYCETSDQCE